MKKTVLFLILVFGFSFANSQINLDSLYNVWEDKTQADSTRVKAFVDYIWDGFLYSKPDTALVLADKLYKFSNNKGYKKGMASALNLHGMGYYLRGDYFKALEHHQRSLNIQKEIENKSGIANSLNNQGMIYNGQGNYLKAIDYYHRSLLIYEEIENKLGVAHALNNIGIIYKGRGDYNKGLDYYQRSLENYEKMGDKQGIANILNNIGNIYTDQSIHTSALTYYERSLSINKEIKNKIGIANNLGNISDVFYQQGDYLKSLNYQQKCLKIREEIGDSQGIAISLRGIGQVYAELANYNKGIKNCKKSLDLVVTIGDIAEQKASCMCLYVIFKVLGDGDKALAYHEKMLLLNDNLKNEETAKKLQQMEFGKQVLADSLVQVEKDLKVEMIHQTEVRKKDKNRNLALGASVFFLVLSGGLFSRWRYVKKSKAVIEKEKDRSDNLLLNILPAEIAEELKEKGSADARDFDLVSILFSDFKGFTQASEKLSAKELIAEINDCFKAFDYICEKYKIEKIKTIGDAYMAAGGLPVPSDDAVKNTVLAALEMQAFIMKRIEEKRMKNETSFEMRLGIHTGPVVAGIVGVKKFQYDIWGDTVNTASRMESSGAIRKVNISQKTYDLIKNNPEFVFESRGKVKAKGKGEIEMYFVTTSS